MLIACWSPKGGSGTTVVAASLGLVLGRSSPGGAVVADLAGDVPAVLGLPDPPGPGLWEWLSTPDEPAPDALVRLETETGAGVRLLGAGAGAGGAPAADGRADALAAALAADLRPVVVDCGRPPAAGGPALAIASGATLSLLVIRPCFLALRRALAAPLRPSAVVLVREAGRVLRAADVEDVLGVPVRAEVDVDPAVARAVDAGLLAARLPRTLERALERAA